MKEWSRINPARHLLRFMFMLFDRLFNITISTAVRLIETGCFRSWVSVIRRTMKKRGVAPVLSIIVKNPAKSFDFGLRSMAVTPAVAITPGRGLSIQRLPGFAGKEDRIRGGSPGSMSHRKARNARKCRDCGHKAVQAWTVCAKCRGYMRIDREAYDNG